MSTRRNATLTRVSGLIIAAGFFFFYLAAPAAADQYVNWMSAHNITINGEMLQKTTGCQGCEDAGAVSRQMLSGDGYVQVVVGETNTFWFAGLTPRTDSVEHSDMPFAFRFNGAGHADVVENGNYKGGDTAYAAGDLFRIAIVGGRVQYLKNGMLLYESEQQPRFPLALAVSVGTVGGTVRNARIETNGAFATTYGAYNPNSTYNPYNPYNPYYDEGGFYGPTFTVNGAQAWTDTGIDIHAGDTITFDANGAIRLSTDPNDVADPLGSHEGRRAPNAPLRNASAGALLARIGNATILIGDHRTITRYPFSGRLYLGVNDDYLSDNSGQYTVSVNVEPYRR